MKVIEKIWSELKIEKEIGRGAYGNVYRCVDTKTDEYSAVKVISVPSAENGLVEYGTDKLSHEETQAYYKEIADDLVKEIEILKSLKGTDNIVEIYDAKIAEKEHGVGWYILIKMELLTEFKAYCAKKDFTEADVLKLGTDLCSALSVCHKAKILHRDIKPENIFVDSDGNFKLGDFGVAKQMEKTQGSMSIKGTFNYMSPEVFGGKRCDNRADLYSLAVVMYKLLNNNRMPFIDKNKDTVRYSERQSAFERRMRGDNIPPISGISNELNMVILKACAFNPVDRYRSAEEFASQLQHIIDGKKIKKSFKKSVIQKIIAAVAAVSVIFGTGAFVWYDINKIDYKPWVANANKVDPDYITVESEGIEGEGRISSRSIDGRYLYYGNEGLYLISEKDCKTVTTDELLSNAYFDGKKIYYYAETTNEYEVKGKYLCIYDVDDDKTEYINLNEEYNVKNILHYGAEKIYFISEDSELKNRRCIYDINGKKVSESDSSFEFKFFYYDVILVLSDSLLKYQKLDDETSPIIVSSEWNKNEKSTFYKDGKDGKLFFVKVDNKLCVLELSGKSNEPIDLADVPSGAEILAMNDKYALISYNESLKLITYRSEEMTGATEIPIYQKHLDEIGDIFQVFVDTEISDKIIISVKKEDRVYFYTIKEDGKLEYNAKTEELPENATINNALVYTFEKKTEESENESEWTIEFKKYEIGR